MKDYIVIKPEQIAPIEEPPFGGRYLEEEEYVDYLRKVQPLIEEWESTGTIHDVVLNSIKDVHEKREEIVFLNNFKAAFLNVGKHIDVRLNSDALYDVASNGRHRMFIAKKYGFKLIVYAD